jgi:serine/threonine protein kinase
MLQDEIIHEAQTMKAYHHPNVLPLYCSFVSGQELWMVMPFVSGGSVLHIMKYAHPEVNCRLKTGSSLQGAEAAVSGQHQHSCLDTSCWTFLVLSACEPVNDTLSPC